MVAERGWGLKRTWRVEVVVDRKKEGEPTRVGDLGRFKRSESVGSVLLADTQLHKASLTTGVVGVGGEKQLQVRYGNWW